MRNLRTCILALLLCAVCSVASALTEEEWNRQVTGKTTSALPIYEIVDYVAAEEYVGLVPQIEQIATLPAGTYVNYGGKYDSSHQMVQVHYWANGGVRSAWLVAAQKHPIGSATVLVYMRDDNSTRWTEWTVSVNEIIAANPSELAAYMRERYPGYKYSLLPASERYDAEGNPTPAPEGGLKPEPGAEEEVLAPAATPEKGNAVANRPNREAGKKPASTETSALPDAFLSAEWLMCNVDPSIAEPQGVAVSRLGISNSDVVLQGEVLTVPSYTLTFAEDVADKHRLAVIYAPRTGRGILRAKASENAKELERCKTGTVVPVLKYGSVWTKIRYNGVEGYIKTSVLTFHDGAATPIGTGVASYRGKATGNTTVPVRSKKSNDAAKVTDLRTATRVEVLSFDGVWYEIDHDGWYGWLHKNYFTYNGE